MKHILGCFSRRKISVATSIRTDGQAGEAEDLDSPSRGKLTPSSCWTPRPICWARTLVLEFHGDFWSRCIQIERHTLLHTYVSRKGGGAATPTVSDGVRARTTFFLETAPALTRGPRVRIKVLISGKETGTISLRVPDFKTKSLSAKWELRIKLRCWARMTKKIVHSWKYKMLKFLGIVKVRRHSEPDLLPTKSYREFLTGIWT